MAVPIAWIRKRIQYDIASFAVDDLTHILYSILSSSSFLFIQHKAPFLWNKRNNGIRGKNLTEERRQKNEHWMDAVWDVTIYTFFFCLSCLSHSSFFHIYIYDPLLTTTTSDDDDGKWRLKRTWCLLRVQNEVDWVDT